MPNSPSAVPEVVPVQTLTFPDAMVALIDGERLTRIEWDDRDTYIFLDARLRIHKSADGLSYDLIVSDGDARATDWVVR